MSEAFFSVERARLTTLEVDFIDFVGRHLLRDDHDLLGGIVAARKGEYTAEGMDQAFPFNHVTFEAERDESDTEDEEDPYGIYHSIELAVVSPGSSGATFVMRGVREAVFRLTHIYGRNHSFFNSTVGKLGDLDDSQQSELIIRGTMDSLAQMKRAEKMKPIGQSN